jgi:hypothetical protein
MQAQYIGYRRSLPTLRRQAHDACPTIAHYIIGALPVIQNIGFFRRNRLYLECHREVHVATSAKKVKVCAVKQH